MRTFLNVIQCDKKDLIRPILDDQEKKTFVPTPCWNTWSNSCSSNLKNPAGLVESCWNGSLESAATRQGCENAGVQIAYSSGRTCHHLRLSSSNVSSLAFLHLAVGKVLHFVKQSLWDFQCGKVDEASAKTKLLQPSIELNLMPRSKE